VYNISEKLELAHAHYEASTMKPPSGSKPQPPPVVPTKSSHSSSRAKAVHSATPILPYYNYCGNLAHKINECNIPSEDLFCDYCGKEGHHESYMFCQVLGTKATPITTIKSANIFRYPSTKSQGTSAFHSNFPHQG
jgi:hypothetical protein